ncbi:MAG: glycosyltransferase [Promethearchaeota archaeon]
MDLIQIISKIIQLSLKMVASIEFLIISFITIFFYHFFLYFLRDKKYITNLRNFSDYNHPQIENFKELPLINIIIPAWKEGEIFRKCLNNLFSLDYPHLNIIVNAGGNEDTISIADSFKSNDNYKYLLQEKGGGKVKAINDCISQVKEGLICLLDADIYLTDDDLLNMLHIILKKNESIVASFLKPHHSQVKKNFIRYLYINRNALFRYKFTRYSKNAISQCTLLKLDVIKRIGKFTEKRLIGDDRSIGLDLMEKNLEIYQLNSKGVQSFNFPSNLKDYCSQNVRWIQNVYHNLIRKSKKRILIFIILIIGGLYLIIFPLLFFINSAFFFVGILLIFYLYLKKVRKICFFKNTTDKIYFGKNSIYFYILLIFFIYLDCIIAIYTALELIFIGDKKFKSRKNIE